MSDDNKAAMIEQGAAKDLFGKGSPSAEELRKVAHPKPVADLHGNPTGWLHVFLLVHPGMDQIVRIAKDDLGAAGDFIRSNAALHAHAIDNPVEAAEKTQEDKSAPDTSKAEAYLKTLTPKTKQDYGRAHMEHLIDGKEAPAVPKGIAAGSAEIVRKKLEKLLRK